MAIIAKVLKNQIKRNYKFNSTAKTANFSLPQYFANKNNQVVKRWPKDDRNVLWKV